MRFAEVIINRPSKKLDRTFTYKIPDALDNITVGWRVIVPFAGGWEEGVVLSVTLDLPAYEVKEIHSGVGTEAWFTPQMLELAGMISSYYVCTRLTALRLFIPGSMQLKLKSGFQLTAAGKSVYPRLSPFPQMNIYWKQHISDENREQYLEEADVPSISLPFPFQTEFTASDQVTDAMLDRRHRQRELFLFLKKNGSQNADTLTRAGFSAALRKEACKNGLIFSQDVMPLTQEVAVKNFLSVQLTNEQREALCSISEAQDSSKNELFLLHGVTGSGKTEVYIRAAENAFQKGKSVLILVPEIALTPQMTARFSARFGNRVIYTHSGLSSSERHANWWRVRHQKAQIVVGARSALFLPYQDLGLIVVDEEYDSSYKQEDSPRYHARRVAEKLGALHDAPVVLGGATPAITTYYRTTQGKVCKLTLSHRIGNIPLPEIQIVDMRAELETGNYSILSRPLYTALGSVLREKKQAILLLNRRGYATYIFCRKCGYVSLCPSCERPLTYHLNGNQLRCHHCERNYPVPRQCPECHSKYIKFMGLGTQKAQQLLTQIFPQARIIRLDRDTMGRSQMLTNTLQAFHDGVGDILLGTQIVAKGHDLPGVQAVGILSVDHVLNLPDYTAAERAFILITQAAGRAGRKNLQGEVVLQTYHPNHYAVRHSRTHDYQGFYNEEIQYRRALRYPPFTELMRITFFNNSYEHALAQALRHVEKLEKIAGNIAKDVEIIGPYDEYIRKIRNQFYISVLVKGDDLSKFKENMRNQPEWAENGIIIDAEVI